MDASFDHYQLLHVQPDAPEAVIKASYRAMMQKLRHHPDLGGDLAMAQQLNEALDTLCDVQRRATYDKQLRDACNRPDADSRRSATRTSTPDCRAAPEATPKAAPDAAPAAAQEHETATNNQTPAGIRLPSHPRCPFCLANYPDRSLGGPDGSSSGNKAYVSGILCYQCQGPVTPVERLDPASEADLRSIYRHDYCAVLTLWDSWPLTSGIRATLSDLSIKGCAAESARALSVNGIILLRADALVAIAQVRYCRQTSGQTAFSIGMEFLTMHVQARPGAVFSATV